MKVCTKCKAEKPLDGFYIHKTGEKRKVGKPFSQCKECSCAQVLASYVPRGRKPGRPALEFSIEGELAKRCTYCKEIKVLEEFFYRKSGDVRKIGKPYAACKACARQRAKTHQNPVMKKLRRRVDKSWCSELKSKIPCMDCGGIFHPACMEFDHLNPEEKSHSISWMVKRGYRRSRILEEMAKCELVCANCHRLRGVTRNDSKGPDVTAHPKFSHVPQQALTLAMTEQDFLIER